MGKKLRVGVLFGGQSGEHEVSLASAQSVIQALQSSGKYEVVPIGITPSGKWIARPDALAVLSAAARFQLPVAAAPARGQAGPREPAQGDGTLRSAALLPDGGGAPLVNLDEKEARAQAIDVVFPVLHGPRGEDGTVQGFLELAGVPFVGAGVTASAVGMDKDLMKTLFRARDLPVVDWVPLRKHAWKADPAGSRGLATGVGFPCFVKPANMGSSVGITKAHGPEELGRGLAEAFRYDTKVIVERGIDAREIECSVLGNDEPQASVPGEIVPRREFYDYRAKYLDQDSELIIPAPLDERQSEEVRELALRAFRAIDCSGMARVDFLLDRRTGKIWLNELNTIPGFTTISMYSKLWEASGIGYQELVDRLIQLALERHGQRSKLEVRYTPSPDDVP